ncbi:MAG: DUF368 domain-containing protein [Aristaeellaceae bacterium]
MSDKRQAGPALRLLEGALIGTGAVLPGVSGGVLMVAFGVYQPVLALLAHPMRAFRAHMQLLLPVLTGVALGFLGIARLLGFVLEAYPAPSVCVFVGLIGGMLPALLREAGERGRSGGSRAALAAAFAVTLSLLTGLKALRLQVTPGFGAYLFCGFCLALSVIAPGMSFSTLLMPLGLYTPFVAGLGRLDPAVLVPAGLGAAVTMLLLARAVTRLLEIHYAPVFHGIIGVVTAATLVIVPYGSFASGAGACLINLCCLAAGIAAALALDGFNRRAAARRG